MTKNPKLFDPVKALRIEISDDLVEVINTVHPLYIPRFLEQTGKENMVEEWDTLIYDMHTMQKINDKDISHLIIQDADPKSWSYYARGSIGLKQDGKWDTPLWKQDTSILGKVDFRYKWQMDNKLRCANEIMFKMDWFNNVIYPTIGKKYAKDKYRKTSVMITDKHGMPKRYFKGLEIIRQKERKIRKEQFTRKKTASGYILIKIGTEWVLEHRYVWEKHNGRPLPEDYIVHHINGIRDDNNPDNLLELPRSGHHNKLVIEAVMNRLRSLEKENDQLKFALSNLAKGEH